MQEVNNKPSLVGKIIHTSWGYDMTINEYAVIVEETDKTVKCKMLKMSVSDDNGKGNGRAMPILEEESEQPFRLHKRQWNGGEIYFKGSYPFCNGSKRSDCFSLWNGQANYHNTWD
jgi:hypothetical protein